MSETRSQVIITLDGRDVSLDMENLGLTLDSTESQIIDAVRGVVRESENVDIADENGEYAYTVRKALNSNTIYVYPKPVAG